MVRPLRPAFTALALLAAAHAYSGPVDDGVAAFAAGDYPRAFELWKPPAEAGNADAQYNIGLLFMQGLGVEKNTRYARQLFMAAAEQGQADAQYNLGLLYYQGNTVFRSNKDAFEWWSRAAAQNHPAAQYNLGVLYAYGIWVGADTNRALALWRSAALQGYREAVELMVRLYERGEFGVEVDATQASYWRERLAR